MEVVGDVSQHEAICRRSLVRGWGYQEQGWEELEESFMASAIWIRVPSGTPLLCVNRKLEGN